VMLLDRAGSVLSMTPSVRATLGYSAADFAGRTQLDFVHPEDREQTRIFLERLVQNPGSTASISHRFRHKDGGWRWLEVVGTSLLNEPAVQAIVTNSRDIT